MARPQCSCKFGISRTCPAHGEKETTVNEQDQYHIWFAKNHPVDWWANKRNGRPLPHRDRLLVDAFARAAFEAGKTIQEQEKANV